LCHFDRSEERAQWRNLAFGAKRQDFSTPKFAETNFSGRNDIMKLVGRRSLFKEDFSLDKAEHKNPNDAKPEQKYFSREFIHGLREIAYLCQY